jgi:regulator of protease activity HflC (stomatin/prohibitin superfamily)
MNKHGILFWIFIALLLTIGSCVTANRVKVEPGFEAVLVDQPYFFGRGGIRQETVKTGAIWTWGSTDAIKVDMRPTQVEEHFDDMMSADNIPVNFHSYIKVHVTNAPQLIEKFGVKWYENNAKEAFRTIIRDLCKGAKMTDLVTDASLLVKMQVEAKQQIAETLVKVGIPVIVDGVTIGRITPNQSVMAAINATAAQQQMQKTQQERAKTEEFRRQGEINRADADNAYRQAMGLSPELFVRLEGIKAFEKAAESCAGSAKCSLVIVPPTGIGITLPHEK